MKRVNGHHRQNDTSVLELDTPIQNYKEAYGQEAYEQATSFYESEEWNKVERDQLNSDRRYYENRKACSLEEYNEWESAEARKQRFQDTPSVVLSAERKVTNGFDDLFDDPVLREAMEVLTEKQYSALYCSFKSRLDNMRKRNTTIAIRCTEEESRRIHELAERHGLKLNDFVMRCALGKKIVVANGIDEIVRQQKAIGRNLNQIATLANMDRLNAVNFQPLLDEHRKVTELIGQLLREVK